MGRIGGLSLALFTCRSVLLQDTEPWGLEWQLCHHSPIVRESVCEWIDVGQTGRLCLLSI